MLVLVSLLGCADDGDGDFALAFDGPPDCGTIELEGSPPDSFTIELWMRGDTDAGDQFRPFVTWPGVFSLAERSDGIVVFSVGEDDAAASSPFSVMDGVLHHLAGAYNGADGTVRLYIDGALQGQNSAFVGEPDGRIQVGCAKEYTEAFSGLLDEVRFSSSLRYDADFERATSPYKVDDDTVMLFHMDEGQGETSESAVGDFVLALTETTWLDFSLSEGGTE